MGRLTPQQFQEKHNRNTKASIEDIRIGVNNVTESPMNKAAGQADKWLNNLQKSKAKWQDRMKAVTLDQWKTAMLDKGINRIADGLDASSGKVIAFAEKLLPFQDNLKATVDKMPDVTLEDSIARATSWIRGMSKFKS